MNDHHNSQMTNNNKMSSYCQILQVRFFSPPKEYARITCTGILVQISHCESQEMLVSAVLFINCLKLSGFNNIKPWTVLFLFHVHVLFEFHRS